MLNEILFYGPVYSYSAQEFFENFNASLEAGTAKRTVRINTEGGEPTYGWGMIAKILENAETTAIKVDGMAYSFGASACCYVDEVEALDVSEFMFHRAAYSDWFEQSEYFTPELQKSLADMNKKLETALRNKIDVEKFEQLKGVKVKDIFSMDSRIDVYLSAKEAKAVGLISKITKITPTKKAELNAMFSPFAERAAAIGAIKKTKNKPVGKIVEEEDEDPAPTETPMETLAELKTKNPELYNQAVALGKIEGAKEAREAEQERIGAWMAFNDVDPEAVRKGIEGGKAMTMKDMAEFTRKGMSANALATVKKDSSGNVITEEVTGEAKAKNIAQFEGEVLANLGLKKSA